jgi:HEAT repeat protein
LEDADSYVRGSAANALGQIGDRLAVEPLAKALLDTDTVPNVRGSAATALGQIGDRLAVEPLAKALLDTDTAPNVRGSAANALGQIGDRLAVEPLAKALLEDADSYVRGSAANALKRIKSGTALSSLRQAAEDQTFDRDICALVVDAYRYIAGRTEAWMRAVGTVRHKRLHGKIVEILARHSEDQEDFIWLRQIACFDLDYASRTEAVRGLARVKQLDTPLLRYLIDPDYQRKDGRLRDTDRGVRGQVGAEVIRHLNTNNPPEDEHLQLVVEMLADPRDTHFSVIAAALSPLNEMPLDKAELALKKIQELVPKQSDERFSKGLENQQTLLLHRKEQTYALAELHKYPEKFLDHFREQAQPRLAQLRSSDNISQSNSPPIDKKPENQSNTDMEKTSSSLQSDIVILTAVKNEGKAVMAVLKEQGISMPEIPMSHSNSRRS